MFVCCALERANAHAPCVDALHVCAHDIDMLWCRHVTQWGLCYVFVNVRAF